MILPMPMLSPRWAISSAWFSPVQALSHWPVQLVWQPPVQVPVQLVQELVQVPVQLAEQEFWQLP